MKKQSYLFPNPQAETNSGATVPFNSVFSPMAYIGEAITEVLFGTVRLGNKLLASWQRQRAINASVRILSKMNDHTLKDIGITRWQIREAAEELVDHSNRYD